jgi:hypothetical protein
MSSANRTDEQAAASRHPEYEFFTMNRAADGYPLWQILTFG